LTEGGSSAAPTTGGGDVPTVPASPDALPDAELRELEDLVQQALVTGRESRLAVLGYGEISLVLAWPPERPRFACKRLPLFSDRSRFASYRRTFDEYLDALRAGGVEPVPSSFRGVERADGAVAGYAVQPVVPAASLAPNVLAEADVAADHPLVAAVVEAAAGVVGPRIGIDAQLSNWTWTTGRLGYLDVTTPMLWSADGRPLLDIELLARPLPWLLRDPVRRFLAPRILDGYRRLRGVYFDLCGNLIKQGLESWLPSFLEHANRHLEERMTVEDVRRYYRSDARLWAALLRVRRLDRAWQRGVRRRPYPFLLPREIQR
jgi:uncharacterized protein DUF6206